MVALRLALVSVLGAAPACSSSHTPLEPSDAGGDADADADSDADGDSDADADSDADGDGDAEPHADCLFGCDFAAECGALPNQVAECRGACDRGEVPDSISTCLAEAARASDCPTWRLCFEPVGVDFCGPWCGFAAECSFAVEDECLRECTNEPPPRPLAECLDAARALADCRQAVACITEPLPEEFCRDLCIRAEDCGFLEGRTAEECMQDCGPIAPEPLVDCINDALDGGTCPDLGRCFRDPGPGEQGCRLVCELRADCNGWTEDEVRACAADCIERVDMGFGPCVTRALEHGSCEEADACFGDLNEPPAGHCEAACDFEATTCELILPEEVARCTELCGAGGQGDDFYGCRQAAIEAEDCAAYLDCAP